MNKLEGVETTIQKNVQTRWSNDDTGRYFGSMMTLRHRAKITKEENVTIREDGGKMLICGNVEKKIPKDVCEALGFAAHQSARPPSTSGVSAEPYDDHHRIGAPLNNTHAIKHGARAIIARPIRTSPSST